MVSILLLLLTSAYFGPAELWSFLGVALTVIGGMGAWIARIKSSRKDKKEDSLSLYVHFVDDLQVELKRLHDLVLEERQEMARVVKEKDTIISQQAAEIVSLTQQLENKGL